jgi:two-component system, cell cycle response regulator DivK
MDRRRPAKPPARPLVLIVEGHDESRAMYALGLSAMGFDVVPTRDGTEGYQRAWEIRPDVIVVDLPAPSVNGWQFLQDLKQNPRTRDIPVVAVTGYIQRPVRERAEREGFTAFFPQHCPADELAAGLRTVLEEKVHAPTR